MNNKKDNAVVFGLTSNYVFAVACVMMDLKKFNFDWVNEVVILHDGISQKQQRLLNKILPCRFIKYIFPIKNESSFDSHTLNYFSKMVFSKYECLRLLNDYHNVIWLDYDIVITQNISELVRYCETGIKMMYLGNKVGDQLWCPVDTYNMNLEGISTGTFILQDHIGDYDEMYNFCYKKTEEYSSVLKYPEQAIFDFMLQEFKINIDIIDKNVYCVHPKDLGMYNNAKIIHSYGQEKFWNEVENKQWKDNYKSWLKIGGIRYNFLNYIIKKLLKNLLRKIGIYKSVKNFLLKQKIN